MRTADLHTDVSWHGVASLEDTGHGVQPWRLPHQDHALYPGGDLIERAAMPAGVRLRFRTDSRRLVLDLRSDADCSPVDVVTGDGVLRAEIGRSPVEFAVPPGLVEVWLPQYGRVLVNRLLVEEGARCEPVEESRPRWIVHGSSITQCRSAPGPTETWSAICATRLGFDHLNLGFGGQCLLDPSIARLIRDERADLVTLCLGINVHGQATHNERSLLPAILGFISTVRDGHPGVPIHVITPISTAFPADEPNSHGLTLEFIRHAIAQAVQILRDRGDRGLHLVHGVSLLGADDTDLLADNVHPNGRGYRQIAERMMDHLARPRGDAESTRDQEQDT
ncbi:hypothetical protein DSM26151_21270 [Agromyces marinus]|uniref:Lipase n=2 Tax=Agromyces marinus TaxID=1389020 RepID=A0ABM8H4N5_9MICO|nr:hypothetical protein DSM26151_21270 [Agromyces marinus]BDZ55768.1 lipase [Agromyces marinus]